jgi:hypothetical protein
MLTPVARAFPSDIVFRTMADTGANTSAVSAHVIWALEHATHNGSVSQTWATGDDVGVRATPCWVCKVQAGQHTTDTRLDDTSVPGASGCKRNSIATTRCCCQATPRGPSPDARRRRPPRRAVPCPRPGATSPPSAGSPRLPRHPSARAANLRGSSVIRPDPVLRFA